MAKLALVTIIIIPLFLASMCVAAPIKPSYYGIHQLLLLGVKGRLIDKELNKCSIVHCDIMV